MTKYNVVECDICGDRRINSFGKIADNLGGAVIDLIRKWVRSEAEGKAYFDGRVDLCKECQEEFIEAIREPVKSIVKSIAHERFSERQKKKFEDTLGE